MSSIDLRPFGNTGKNVTRVGLGGEGVLRTYGRTKEAVAVIKEAISRDITYFDSANAYSGSEGYYGAYWSEHPDIRKNIFQTSKSARRDYGGAMAELDNTLRTMGIDHLDLWQIHDVRTEEDIEELEGPGGALDAFIDAKKSGKIKHIGVTGHHDPDIITYTIENWPVDSVLLPVNPVEGVLGGFLDETLTAAHEKGIAVVGMKVLGASYYISKKNGITPELLIRYALSRDITLAIVGCSSPAEVRTLANAGGEFTPMSDEEQIDLEDRFRPAAKKLAYYRGVIKQEPAMF